MVFFRMVAAHLHCNICTWYITWALVIFAHIQSMMQQRNFHYDLVNRSIWFWRCCVIGCCWTRTLIDVNFVLYWLGSGFGSMYLSYSQTSMWSVNACTQKPYDRPANLIVQWRWLWWGFIFMLVVCALFWALKVSQFANGIHEHALIYC